MTNQTLSTRSFRPRTVHGRSIKKLIENGYQIDTVNGRVFNSFNEEVGSIESKYEPRVSVRLDGKKVKARINKIVGFAKYGPKALHSGNQIRHRNGDIFDNRAANLELVLRSR